MNIVKVKGGVYLYKIIFFDIDGTLRNETSTVSETTKCALEKCREKGIKIYLCTGRSIGTIPKDVQKLKFDGVIAGGGCYIKIQDKILKDKFFNKNDICCAYEYLKQQLEKTAYTFETKNKIFMNKEAQQILQKSNYEKWKNLSNGEIKRLSVSQNITYENNMSEFCPKTTQIHKICLWCKNVIFSDLKIILMNKFKLVQTHKFDDRNYYEIIENSSDKGNAIKMVCDFLKIPIENTLAFGDSKNDIDMFQTVFTSVLMKNGDPELFSYASSVCESVNDNGIFMELKRRNII